MYQLTSRDRLSIAYQGLRCKAIQDILTSLREQASREPAIHQVNGDGSALSGDRHRPAGTQAFC